jgi:hypothetical protein
MKLTLIILSIILALSCGKKKERVLHLKAINPVTGEALPGLAWGVSATRTGYDGEKLVFDKNGTLDANGEASLTVKLKDAWTYNIRVIKPGQTH